MNFLRLGVTVHNAGRILLITNTKYMYHGFTPLVGTQTYSVHPS